jgi:hypothetical protein
MTVAGIAQGLAGHRLGVYLVGPVADGPDSGQCGTHRIGGRAAELTHKPRNLCGGDRNSVSRDAIAGRPTPQCRAFDDRKFNFDLTRGEPRKSFDRFVARESIIRSTFRR